VNIFILCEVLADFFFMSDECQPSRNETDGTDTIRLNPRYVYVATFLRELTSWDLQLGEADFWM